MLFCRPPREGLAVNGELLAHPAAHRRLLTAGAARSTAHEGPAAAQLPGTSLRIQHVPSRRQLSHLLSGARLLG